MISLRRPGHRGRVVALSRRRLLPQPHAAAPGTATFDATSLAATRGGHPAFVRALRGRGGGGRARRRRARRGRRAPAAHVGDPAPPAAARPGDLRHAPPTLVASIVRRGLATPDALGLGLETDRAGRLVGRGGEAAPDLYAIGPPRARALWASTAVPEIRVRARDVANRLLRARRRAAR